MKTNVYIDGFNLYYRLKNTPYKWLNVMEMCKYLLPNNTINRIRYYIARVSGRSDVQQPLRQDIYLRALRTIPILTIHEGKFLESKVRMPLVQPVQSGPKTVEVWKTEEKGSDVNLSCHMLLDAFHQDCEVVALVSNDSDLAEPIRVIRKEFGLKVIVIHPVSSVITGSRKISTQLKRFANKSFFIDDPVLAQCQFPNVLQDIHGTITKPSTW